MLLSFLQTLVAHASLIPSHQHLEELERLRIALTTSTMRLKNGGTADSASSEEYAEDIEAEANSYFQQMFSGQLMIDAMVQMLTRFKESSVKRYTVVKSGHHILLLLGLCPLKEVTYEA